MLGVQSKQNYCVELIAEWLSHWAFLCIHHTPHAASLVDT